MPKLRFELLYESDERITRFYASSSLELFGKLMDVEQPRFLWLISRNLNKTRWKYCVAWDTQTMGRPRSGRLPDNRIAFINPDRRKDPAYLEELAIKLWEMCQVVADRPEYAA